MDREHRPRHRQLQPAAVKDITISGSTAYVSSEGTGGGCFDGDFAVNLGNSGGVTNDTLVWQNDCLGATQAIVVIHGYLFKGSHAHDCAYAPGGFPQVNNNSGGWVTHHLLDQSLTDGSVGHWTPNTDGTVLGPRAMATDGNQLFVGGDFENVNNEPQQGFARFAAGLPNRSIRRTDHRADRHEHLGGRRHGELPDGQQRGHRHAEL